MIPHTDAALRMLSQRLMTQLLPDLKTTYSLSDGALVGLLMNAIADETAEGIQRRLTDIGEMQGIFRDVVDELSKAEQIQASAEPASYRLQDVNELHDSLTRLLIVLHERAEAGENDALQQAIWQYLRRHATRHQITAVP